MKEIGKPFDFSIFPEEHERRNGTVEIWFESKNRDSKYLIRFVRPFRVQKILNTNYYLN